MLVCKYLEPILRHAALTAKHSPKENHLSLKQSDIAPMTNISVLENADPILNIQFNDKNLFACSCSLPFLSTPLYTKKISLTPREPASASRDAFRAGTLPGSQQCPWGWGYCRFQIIMPVFTNRKTEVNLHANTNEDRTGSLISLQHKPILLSFSGKPQQLSDVHVGCLTLRARALSLLLGLIFEST